MTKQTKVMTDPGDIMTKPASPDLHIRQSDNLFYFSPSSNKYRVMKTPTRIVLACAALLGLAACNGQMGTKNESGGNNDKAAAMKDRFKILNEAFNTGNTAAVDTLLADNTEDHSTDTSMHLPKGKEGLKQMIGMMRQGTPDLKSDIKYVAVDGDILMAYGTMGGTNSGPMQGMPATNKKWSADFADIVRFDNNMKMAEHWGVYDEMKIAKDLGLMPAPGAAMANMEKPAAPPEKGMMKPAAPPEKK